MKKILIVLMVGLLLVGCGKIQKVTETETDTVYIEREKTIRIPTPISRPFSKSDIDISLGFNSVPEMLIERIIVNRFNGLYQDQVAVNVPPGNMGKKVQVYVNGGHGTIYISDNNQNTISFCMMEISESSSVTCLHIPEENDVLVTANQTHYVQLVIDNVVIEQYYLIDFYAQ